MKNSKQQHSKGCLSEMKIFLQTSGEVVETVTVSRGPETTFHTQLSALKEEKGISLQPEEVEALRREIQEQLQLHKQVRKEVQQRQRDFPDRLQLFFFV